MSSLSNIHLSFKTDSVGCDYPSIELDSFVETGDRASWVDVFRRKCQTKQRCIRLSEQKLKRGETGSI